MLLAEASANLAHQSACMHDDPDWLEYFSGGVPTGEFFRLTLSDLRDISLSDNEKNGISRIQQLCFIGLIAYFEAFCKDHFASLLNIEPGLVSNLKTKGQNVEIDATRITLYGQDIQYRIGFLLAERYDFGTAQKINALFGALLNQTPFGKTEAVRYSEFLQDRNLLVHHGGTYTLSYLEQTSSISCDLQGQAFFHSRTLQRAEVTGAINFIEDIARKLVDSSHAALVRYIQERNFQYTGEHLKALDAIASWGDTDP